MGHVLHLAKHVHLDGLAVGQRVLKHQTHGCCELGGGFHPAPHQHVTKPYARATLYHPSLANGNILARWHQAIEYPRSIVEGLADFV